MDKTILAYIAGIVDGEGTIACVIGKKGKYSWYSEYIRVHMKYSKIPKFLQKTWGGNLYHDKKRGAYIWQIWAKESRKLCKQLMPYLIEKERQAEIILELEKLKYKKLPHKQEQLYNELKSLHN